MGQKYAASDSTGAIVAFYDSIDSPVPGGVNAVEITDQEWLALLDAQAIGKRIAIDATGAVVTLDPLPPTREQVAASMRTKRDTALKATDWLVARHQDEKLIGDGTTLTADQFTALLRYRQALRDIADAPGWPNIDLPAPPEFLS